MAWAILNYFCLKLSTQSVLPRLSTLTDLGPYCLPSTTHLPNPVHQLSVEECSCPFIAQRQLSTWLELRDPEYYINRSVARCWSQDAPNTNLNPFFTHLLQVIYSHQKGTLIICGDSNQVTQPHLYKSPYTSDTHFTSVTFHLILQQASLFDSRCECNPIWCN